VRFRGYAGFPLDNHMLQHPDHGSARIATVIMKMGVKEVLHRTKHLGWGPTHHL
jgi:hypothetical protein